VHRGTAAFSAPCREAHVFLDFRTEGWRLVHANYARPPVSGRRKGWSRNDDAAVCCRRRWWAWAATTLLPNHPERRRSTPYAVSPKCRDLRALHPRGLRWKYSRDFS